MKYYEVLVASLSYHGSGALTYEWPDELAIGSIVRISLRQKTLLGIVVKQVSKPDFETKLIKAVTSFPALPIESLKLMDWLKAYYPAPLGAIVRQFVPPVDAPPKSLRLKDIKIGSAALPPLTSEQQNAVQAIDGPGTFLLHGITGSGKSRVYIELAKRVLSTGKSALILTPEIGLTAQLARTFQASFGEIYILHSHMTAAERRDAWYEILAQNKPIIIMGPRSALFAPVRNLGLVVLDEAHDTAYKNESAPNYQASRVAAKLTELHKATLVLGSATPSVEDYYLATQLTRPIITMSSLAKEASRLDIELVDMKSRDEFSRSPLLSNRLITQIAKSIQRGEQALLYLNRRGTANVVLCNQCGWQSVCPNCDLTLTYHGDSHQLRCHVCGYHTHLPTNCPECGNTDILFKSAGTKAIVSAAQKIFPEARIRRFDTDARKDERLEHHLDNLAVGGADIIVGTQMIGKGLDLPKLSTVGVINADSSLLIPDYTAGEQTFQLLAQVIGRVGRGHLPGTVVVQTYNPGNPSLLAAVHRQWQEFYDVELNERRTFHFPPFAYLLKLRVLRASDASAQKAALDLCQSLELNNPGITVDGPAPSFHPREKGKFSWQLLVKSSRRSTLVNIISTLPSGWTYDIDPINLL